MKCEAALFNLLSCQNPQTLPDGIGSMGLLLVLFGLAQSVNMAQRVRSPSWYLSGQASVRPKLREKFSTLISVRLFGHTDEDGKFLLKILVQY